MSERPERCQTCRYWREHAEERKRWGEILADWDPMKSDMVPAPVPCCHKEPRVVEKWSCDWCGHWEAKG